MDRKGYFIWLCSLIVLWKLFQNTKVLWMQVIYLVFIAIKQYSCWQVSLDIIMVWPLVCVLLADDGYYFLQVTDIKDVRSILYWYIMSYREWIPFISLISCFSFFIPVFCTTYSTVYQCTWQYLILQIKAKDPNVIIIDTNTLLKNQGNLAAAVAQSNTTGSSNVQTIHPRSTTTSSNTVSNMSIQNAIQAITGGVPAQGLQSAYITALQQVCIALDNIFQ